ncbi:MAG: hypothetical protein HUK03_00165, partial [Bacteroidaceae bacterium]|nr:hypothetical protein [Bacteroidaceae bacterium]
MKRLLHIFMLLLTSIGVWAQTSPYAGNEVAAGTEWYIYNVESGTWLGNNNRVWGDWTTRAQVNDVGLDWEIISYNGGWQLNPKFNGNKSMNSSNGYLDTSDAITAWTFTEVSCEGATKAYRISADGKRLGVNADGNLDYGTDGTWVLVNREQRLAIASDTNPVDASFLIPCYDMSDNNPRFAWTLTTNGNQSGPKVMWEHNRVWETWGVTSMDAYTTCTNIPNGKYLVYSIGAYVPTGGDQMNESDYNDYKTNGSAAVHALAYANEKTAKMSSVYSVENSAQENERWTKEVKSGVWIPGGWGAIANMCGHYNKYWSDPVEVIVTDHTLRVGVKMEDGAPNTSWVVLSGMRMKYYGIPEDILAKALEALNNAIAAAQALDQNKLTSKAQAQINEKLAAAQALTESRDLDAIGNATSALNEVYNRVKDMDAATLRATIDYIISAAPTVDVSAAEDVYVNGETPTAVNDAKNSVIIKFKQEKATRSAMPTQFTKVTETPVGTNDNNRYFTETDLAKGLYMYNVGTGRWFCGGDDWGAHAAVGYPGIKVTLPEDNYESGKYNGIVTWLCNGNWGENAKLNHGGYCDTGGNGWKFFSVDATNGIVTIARNGSNTGDQSGNGCGTKNLLGFSDYTLMRADTDKEGANN